RAPGPGAAGGRARAGRRGFRHPGARVLRRARARQRRPVRLARSGPPARSVRQFHPRTRARRNRWSGPQPGGLSRAAGERQARRWRFAGDERHPDAREPHPAAPRPPAQRTGGAGAPERIPPAHRRWPGQLRGIGAGTQPGRLGRGRGCAGLGESGHVRAGVRAGHEPPPAGRTLRAGGFALRRAPHPRRRAPYRAPGRERAARAHPQRGARAKARRGTGAVGARRARPRLRRDPRRPATVKHIARKRFGQHFLTDPGVIDAIVRAIDPRAGDAIVEIGPGLAALTQPLVERLGRLRVIELDRDLAARLRAHGQLDVSGADVLTVAFRPPPSAAPASPRVVGTLPYTTSPPILVPLLDHVGVVKGQHFMLQKGVIDRMVAAPATADYGRLSVMLPSRYAMENLLFVPPEPF